LYCHWYPGNFSIYDQYCANGEYNRKQSGVCGFSHYPYLVRSGWYNPVHLQLVWTGRIFIGGPESGTFFCFGKLGGYVHGYCHYRERVCSHGNPYYSDQYQTCSQCRIRFPGMFRQHGPAYFHCPGWFGGVFICLDRPVGLYFIIGGSGRFYGISFHGWNIHCIRYRWQRVYRNGHHCSGRIHSTGGWRYNRTDVSE
jgi:hypothetical protein